MMAAPLPPAAAPRTSRTATTPAAAAGSRASTRRTPPPWPTITTPMPPSSTREFTTSSCRQTSRASPAGTQLHQQSAACDLWAFSPDGLLVAAGRDRLGASRLAGSGDVEGAAAGAGSRRLGRAAGARGPAGGEHDRGILQRQRHAGGRSAPDRGASRVGQRPPNRPGNVWPHAIRRCL